jgi:hypothetical protein
MMSLQYALVSELGKPSSPYPSSGMIPRPAQSYRYQFNHVSFIALFSPLNPQESLVSIAIVELADLSLVPAGKPGEISRNSGDAVHIARTTIATDLRKSSARPVAAITRGKLRAEGDLIILGLGEGFDHETGQGFL